MHNEPSTEQAVAVKIATDATEPPMKFFAKMKAAISELSARQILKVVLLGLALIVWYPVYSRLNPFSSMSSFVIRSWPQLLHTHAKMEIISLMYAGL